MFSNLERKFPPLLGIILSSFFKPRFTGSKELHEAKCFFEKFSCSF